MKISGILLDVSSFPGSIKEYTLDEMSLEDFYKALHCNTIDIVRRLINGKVFDIVCDDNGLLMEEPVVTAINERGEMMLVGNLFICNSEGSNLVSLSKDDVTHIMNSAAVHAKKSPHEDKYNFWPIIMNVDECR